MISKLVLVDPLEEPDDDLDDDDPAAVARQDQVDAAYVDAARMHGNIEDRFRAQGMLVVDDDLPARIRNLFQRRLDQEPHFECSDLRISIHRVWAGLALAIVCDRPACRAALEDLKAAEADLAYCAVCDRRDPWLSLVQINIPIMQGLLQTSVHALHVPSLSA